MWILNNINFGYIYQYNKTLCTGNYNINFAIIIIPDGLRLYKRQ